MIHRLFLPFLVSLAIVAGLRADTGSHTKGEAPAHIAHGEKIDLADYLVPGKTTVFDFYSEYCGPCRRIAPDLEKLHAKQADIVVVKVDINRPNVKGIDWQSPVAREFGLQMIPHFKVFGPDGKLLAEDKVVVSPEGKLVTNDQSGSTLVQKWLQGAGN